MDGLDLSGFGVNMIRIRDSKHMAQGSSKCAVDVHGQWKQLCADSQTTIGLESILLFA